MIYFDNTTDAQHVYIPTDTEVVSGSLTLTLFSTVDNAVRATLSVTPDDNGEHYYGMDVTLPQGLSDGEYAYTLEQDGENLAEGVAQVGEYVPHTMEYEKTIEYEQL